jgi:hypothetical protein
MAYSKHVREKARQFFIHNFPDSVIKERLGVAPSTVQRWAKDEGWKDDQKPPSTMTTALYDLYLAYFALLDKLAEKATNVEFDDEFTRWTLDAKNLITIFREHADLTPLTDAKARIESMKQFMVWLTEEHSLDAVQQPLQLAQQYYDLMREKILEKV